MNLNSTESRMKSVTTVMPRSCLVFSHSDVFDSFVSSGGRVA